MKIENFQLRMDSKYEQETLIKASFENELQIEESQRTREKIEVMEYEKRLQSQMHLMLIRQFLQQLYNAYKQSESPIEPMPQQREAESFVHVERIEHQKFELNMGGFIQTDTQKIAIDISVSMSHTLISQSSFEASHCIDPLIINFEGEMPSLSDTSFHFDIDNDGASDQISMLKDGNGFLALDRDENGTIDSGSELFGTVLGNGFAELSLFDDDSNLWIDENDPILDKLRIWVNNDGENELLALGELGIGAIYLGSVRSEFQYKSQEQNLGELRSSGLFLYENGQSGIISQIDLAKQEKNSVLKEEPLANLIMQG
ncbi:MAG: hypothetical protein U9R50_08405 [Campylobacterota bacterium]|nr:hypothetical protein [Campylobacterota bacterium]